MVARMYDPGTRLRGDLMRHTTTTTAATAVLLLALTACGSSNSGGDDGDSKPATASPSPSSSQALAAQYLAESQPIPFTSAALKDGHSVEWTFSGSGGDLYPNGVDWGMVQKDAYRLLIAGVRVYCPNRLDTVTKELRETGEY
jgi:hypothetical protein